VTDDGNDLDHARQRLGLSHYDLWVRYIGVGGTRDAFAVRRYLTGRDTLTDRDHDHVIAALNEAFIDAGDGRRLPYRHA
jgi:hypothetical protein